MDEPFEVLDGRKSIVCAGTSPDEIEAALRTIFFKGQSFFRVSVNCEAGWASVATGEERMEFVRSFKIRQGTPTVQGSDR